MLKTLKWVYGLGVRQERVRIAAHLKTRLSQATVNASTYRGVFGDDKNNIPKVRKNKIEKAIAVQDEVRSILEEILNPNWEQSMTASIMFPDDEHKGKVK